MKILGQLFASFLYRKEQLVIQENNDKMLDKISEQCPYKVLDYLMLDRHFNRLLTNKYQTLNPFDIYKVTSENLEMTNKEIHQFNKYVCDCDSLNRYLLDFKSRISKYQTQPDT